MKTTDETPYMSIKEFREKGYLQELNRMFLHPLGLALTVESDEDGNETLGGILDGRDDEEGIVFDWDLVDTEFYNRAVRVEDQRYERDMQRAKSLGWIHQPTWPEKKDA